MTKIEKNKLILRTNVANCMGTTEICNLKFLGKPKVSIIQVSSKKAF